MLALVTVVIVFIVSRASDLVLLVKRLLGVSGWLSDVWSRLPARLDFIFKIEFLSYLIK